MFTVKYKEGEDKLHYKVYAVNKHEGYALTEFLLYKNGWEWVDSRILVPID